MSKLFILTDKFKKKNNLILHLFRILDDQEMYEDQKVLKLTDMAKMASFVNQLCYKLISHHNNGRMRESAWTALKTLLMVLYRRDCRRKYCPDEHWLIESSKMTQLISDIEKGKKHAKVQLYILMNKAQEKLTNNCNCKRLTPFQRFSL